VVTGTEVLSGRVRDRNGPWLADRLFEAGVELSHLTICGDRPQDMQAQLEFMQSQGVDVVITSGGLGPTADDKTVEVVAGFAGASLVLDEALEKRIAEIVAPLARRFRNTDSGAFSASTRKQAFVPEGSVVLGPAGTAPGLVVPPVDGSKPTVVVLPGPPRELHETWQEAVSTEPFRAAVSKAALYNQRTLRLFGIPESEIASTLRVAEDSIEGFEGLEITTCLRRAEVEMVVRYEPQAERALNRLLSLVAERHQNTLFSTDGSSVDAQVAGLLESKSVGLAESCTGGLLAGRLTERPGSSAYVAGGIVCYSDEAKRSLLGVGSDLLDTYGAVSPQAAEAMAAGALSRLEADVAAAITGVAGPGGGSSQKPVGYVCLCVADANGGTLTRDLRLPGDRFEIRDRSTTMAMHMLRCHLSGKTFPL
jgi:nicotinamide-nucleotide amidase